MRRSCSSPAGARRSCGSGASVFGSSAVIPMLVAMMVVIVVMMCGHGDRDGGHGRDRAMMMVMHDLGPRAWRRRRPPGRTALRSRSAARRARRASPRARHRAASEPVRQHLDRHMPVAEMPGEPGEMREIVAADFGQRSGSTTISTKSPPSSSNASPMRNITGSGSIRPMTSHSRRSGARSAAGVDRARASRCR